jgi:gentisate 1,2-dioxygenase
MMKEPTTVQTAEKTSPQQRPQSIADLPAQHAAAPKTAAQARARYFNSGNAFNVKLSPVPDRNFIDEPARALDPATPTGLIPCDRSAQLGCAYPATTPLVLARYARIRAGKTLTTEFATSGVIGYVITGHGTLECAGEQMDWNAGDVFVVPGGGVHRYRAEGADAVLWLATNEPQVAFESLRAPAPDAAPTGVVHFPRDEIERQVALLYEIGRGDDIAGSALIFSSDRQEASRNALPTLTVAMNSLPPGASQRPHRHNSVAVTLVIEGERCHSVVDGVRKDWSRWATTVTPATSVHSHHNAGERQALFLIVQDGGIYSHTRALGFEFTEQ